MTNQSIWAGHEPRFCLYPKTSRIGNVTYYLQYYLPGGARVSRPMGKKKKEAKARAFKKEAEVRGGIFDEKDLERIPPHLKPGLIKPKISLKEAMDRFIEATSYNRRPRTNRLTHGVLKNLIGLLEAEFIDEVKGEHVQRLAGMLQSKGLSQATVYSYLSILKTFFNWLIEGAEVLEGRNPVNQVKKPPRSSKVRDYLVEPELIKKLLEVQSLSSREGVPIIPLVRYLMTTGCRLGEAIHLEWNDIEFDQAIWMIKEKPHCPTIDALGWRPKWNKPRMIELLPEALDVLRGMNRHPVTWGSVRENGAPEWHRADFVFTVKKKVETDVIKEERQVRIGSVKRAWGNLLEEARIPKIQIKDLRTFFNWVLISHFGLSHKEAGSYLGNSEQVNYEHYSPVSLSQLSSKLKAQAGGHFIPQLLG